MSNWKTNSWGIKIIKSIEASELEVLPRRRDIGSSKARSAGVTLSKNRRTKTSVTVRHVKIFFASKKQMFTGDTERKTQKAGLQFAQTLRWCHQWFARRLQMVNPIPPWQSFAPGIPTTGGWGGGVGGGLLGSPLEFFLFYIAESSHFGHCWTILSKK